MIVGGHEARGDWLARARVSNIGYRRTRGETELRGTNSTLFWGLIEVWHKSEMNAIKGALNEVGESRCCCFSLLRVLQFLPRAFHFARYARNGSWDRQPCMDD